MRQRWPITAPYAVLFAGFSGAQTSVSNLDLDLRVTEADIQPSVRIYERNLGASSGVDIKRGLNALWNHGRLLYAPPTR